MVPDSGPTLGQSSRDHGILLLVGGDKGSQKKDINQAQQYWAQYLEDAKELGVSSSMLHRWRQRSLSNSRDISRRIFQIVSSRLRHANT
jgi:hypothetical protein